ncbi:hypothetical protein [Capillibacterium thermochitinicola]|uniref:Uncharacterized protein n=1 Tax=Capillibacterium thermochitinicola TaxID=2699427 RepID=A0A8J6I1D1_9FIRM|nr:hypothetical protein [Capillibacterium thermochitinicola]MBA2133193.1 hypothetical protein [Capillibacterium thermochitinicola]
MTLPSTPRAATEENDLALLQTVDRLQTDTALQILKQLIIARRRPAA